MAPQRLHVLCCWLIGADGSPVSTLIQQAHVPCKLLGERRVGGVGGRSQRVHRQQQGTLATPVVWCDPGVLLVAVDMPHLLQQHFCGGCSDNCGYKPAMMIKN